MPGSMHTADTAHHDPGDRQCLCQRPLRTGRGGNGLWLHTAASLSPCRFAAGHPWHRGSAVFTFVMSWNEVFAASILTVQNRTLPAVVLFALNQSSEPYQFAGGFFLPLPALIFIFFIRRYLFNMWGQVSK